LKKTGISSYSLLPGLSRGVAEGREPFPVSGFEILGPTGGLLGCVECADHFDAAVLDGDALTGLGERQLELVGRLGRELRRRERLAGLVSLVIVSSRLKDRRERERLDDRGGGGLNRGRSQTIEGANRLEHRGGVGLVIFEILHRPRGRHETRRVEDGQIGLKDCPESAAHQLAGVAVERPDRDGDLHAVESALDREPQVGLLVE
jgi:hypothetical protein